MKEILLTALANIAPVGGAVWVTGDCMQVNIRAACHAVRTNR